MLLKIRHDSHTSRSIKTKSTQTFDKDEIWNPCFQHEGKSLNILKSSTKSELHESKYWVLSKTLSPGSNTIDANIY